jgi:rhodanese-related sulfurtransferase
MASEQEEAMVDRPDVPEVDVAETARRLDAGEILLLDVREDDEWQAGHAPQAVHVQLGKLAADRIPTTCPVVVVCRSGNRSAHATAALVAAGLEARNLAGGMRAWAAAGRPVQKPDGSPGQVD